MISVVEDIKCALPFDDTTAATLVNVGAGKEVLHKEGQLQEHIVRKVQQYCTFSTGVTVLYINISLKLI